MRKNSIKNTRINGEVQKELSTIIRNEIKDPRIHPMTSVMAGNSSFRWTGYQCWCDHGSCSGCLLSDSFRRTGFCK